MQKFILACVFIISGTCVLAQNGIIKADPRVADHFGQEKIELWQNSNSDSIRYYNFIASHAFEVYSQEYINAVKPAGIQPAVLRNSEKTALQSDISSFNIFSCNIPWKSSDNQWYSIEGTDLYLLIHSIDFLNNKFNAGK